MRTDQGGQRCGAGGRPGHILRAPRCLHGRASVPRPRCSIWSDATDAFETFGGLLQARRGRRSRIAYARSRRQQSRRDSDPARRHAARSGTAITLSDQGYRRGSGRGGLVLQPGLCMRQRPELSGGRLLAAEALAPRSGRRRRRISSSRRRLQASGSAVEAGARAGPGAAALVARAGIWFGRGQPNVSQSLEISERVQLDPDGSGGSTPASSSSASAQRDQRDLADVPPRTWTPPVRPGAGWRGAASELRRAVYLSPYEAQAHLLIGRIYLRGGRAGARSDALKISIWSADTAQAHVAPRRRRT